MAEVHKVSERTGLVVALGLGATVLPVFGGKSLLQRLIGTVQAQSPGQPPPDEFSDDWVTIPGHGGNIGDSINITPKLQNTGNAPGRYVFEGWFVDPNGNPVLPAIGWDDGPGIHTGTLAIGETKRLSFWVVWPDSSIAGEWEFVSTLYKVDGDEVRTTSFTWPSIFS